MTAGQVVLSGVLGTVPLLMTCQHGMLKDPSPQLGNFVRTNNEAIVGLSIRDDSEDFTDGVAITSKVALDKPDPVRYSAGSDALNSPPCSPTGGSVPRALRWVATCVRHPHRAYTLAVRLGQEVPRPPRDADHQGTCGSRCDGHGGGRSR